VAATQPSSAFPHLFAPLRLGGLEARNRVVSSTYSKLYGQRGTDSQRMIDYFAERAEGGVGIAPRRIDHAIYGGDVAGREQLAFAARAILDGELEVLR
jgi:2,4-dienoyl-CoA reductase-like NADH-dependent reductase (Old Yellow Enzyme family)